MFPDLHSLAIQIDDEDLSSFGYDDKSPIVVAETEDEVRAILVLDSALSAEEESMTTVAKAKDPIPYVLVMGDDGNTLVNNTIVPARFRRLISKIVNADDPDTELELML